MSEIFDFIVTEDDSGNRIDKFLGERLENQTRSAIQKLIENGKVSCSGKKIGKSFKLKAGNEISVEIPEAVPYEAKAENIPLDIVFEDDDLLVVNKPQGMVVHPAAGNYEGTLVNALLYHCGDSLSGINGIMRPGIVHRIDKDTSGLLIVAKNDFAHQGLAEQIKVHSFTRYYEAVVHGRVKNDSGTVNAPIGRHPIERKKMTVTVKNSKEAITHYNTVSVFDSFSHMRLKLETGRTHQIRVHMAYLGHPVAGDPMYGPKKSAKGLDGQCLHAKEIGFVHPRTGKEIYLTSELPDYFKSFLDSIK